MASKIYFSTTCPICNRSADSPARTYDAKGEVTQGCVDHFHTGHLVTPSASAHWHARPVAKRIRADIRKMRDGCVTERAA